MFAHQSTKSPTMNCLGTAIVLYLAAFLCLRVASLMHLIYLVSSSMSRFSLLSYSFYFCWKFSHCHDGYSVSTEITASPPHTKLKGVSLVVLCRIVWYLQSTWSNCSIHHSLAWCSLFLIPLRRTLFTASACPLICKWSTEVKCCFIDRLESSSWNLQPMNYVLLFVTTYFGIPNRVMMLL